jgi:hypothetical protein
MIVPNSTIDLGPEYSHSAHVQLPSAGPASSNFSSSGL